MSGCSVTAVVSDGSVTQLIIDSGGDGYIRLPNIFIDPPETGSDQASALVTDLSNNSVYKILITNPGGSYESPPKVYVQDAVRPDIIQAVRGWDTYPSDNPCSSYRVVSSYYLDKFFQRRLPETCQPGLVLTSGGHCNYWTDSISLSALTLIPQNQPPTVFTIGTLYYDSVQNKMGYWNGSIWNYF